MRISKKGIEDIINRLYTVEQDGEKVIRRDRLDELFTIVTGRYDNAGCSVEKVLGGEKLVITSVNKNGIKKIFERKIEVSLDVSNTYSSIGYVDKSWHKKELISLLNGIIEEYGMSLFKDKKRSVGVISDKLYEFPEECKILRMLFNEGIYSILDEGKVHGEEDNKFLKVRLVKFMDKLGMEADVKTNIAEILMAVFVAPKKMEKASGIMNECEVGKIYFIAEENSLEKELRLYQIESDIKEGSGLFHKQGISTYIEATNAATDAYRYICDECSICGMKEFLGSKDFKLSFGCVDGGQLTSQVMIGTLLALCSGAIDKAPLSGLIVLGKTNSNENQITTEDVIKCFEICEKHQARFLLLPITLTVEFPKVPADLLGKVSMVFYTSLDDMIIKALDISKVNPFVKTLF